MPLFDSNNDFSVRSTNLVKQLHEVMSISNYKGCLLKKENDGSFVILGQKANNMDEVDQIIERANKSLCRSIIKGAGI